MGNHRVDRIVGQQEEVAIAVREFHLGGDEVIVGQCEIGIHEALQVALALDELAHGRGIVISLADEREERSPVAVESCLIKVIIQSRNIDGMDGTVFIQEILIVLQAYIVVGDDQLEPLANDSTNSKHTIIIEQTNEIAKLHHPLGWEMRDQTGFDKTFLRYVMNDFYTLTFCLVYSDETLQLAVVCHRVRVDKLFRFASRVHECGHIIADHVTVEHAGLGTETVLSKAIVIVPRFDICDDAVLCDFRLDSSYFFVIADHLSHVFL